MPRVHNKYHGTAPPDAVNIMRRSKWGNPFKVGIDGSRAEVIALFEKNTLPHLPVMELDGKDLVCCCKPLPCHGDSILARINQIKEENSLANPPQPSI